MKLSSGLRTSANYQLLCCKEHYQKSGKAGWRDGSVRTQVQIPSTYVKSLTQGSKADNDRAGHLSLLFWLPGSHAQARAHTSDCVRKSPSG